MCKCALSHCAPVSSPKWPNSKRCRPPTSSSSSSSTSTTASSRPSLSQSSPMLSPPNSKHCCPTKVLSSGAFLSSRPALKIFQTQKHVMAHRPNLNFGMFIFEWEQPWKCVKLAKWKVKMIRMKTPIKNLFSNQQSCKIWILQRVFLRVGRLGPRSWEISHGAADSGAHTPVIVIIVTIIVIITIIIMIMLIDCKLEGTPRKQRLSPPVRWARRGGTPTQGDPSHHDHNQCGWWWFVERWWQEGLFHIHWIPRCTSFLWFQGSPIQASFFSTNKKISVKKCANRKKQHLQDISSIWSSISQSLWGHMRRRPKCFAEVQTRKNRTVSSTSSLYSVHPKRPKSTEAVEK